MSVEIFSINNWVRFSYLKYKDTFKSSKLSHFSCGGFNFSTKLLLNLSFNLSKENCSCKVNFISLTFL